MNERILVVEDDPSSRESLGLVLTDAGYGVIDARDGREALTAFTNHAVDLVLLDIMMPLLDGLEVCKQIRRDSQVPIIMLTAKTDTIDIVVGLESGADDYITKPFQMTELLARIKAALRRTIPQGDSTLHLGPFEIDPGAHRVWKGGTEIHLTATEFRLLLELARNRGRVLSRATLLDRVWEYDYFTDSRLVDMAVKRLRHKIESDPSDPKVIITVRGAGYRLEAP